jgi:hypothetical protein
MHHMRFTCSIATVAAASIGSTVFADGPPTDDSGWTILTPAAGARLIYVSSSTGSDSNSGLSTSVPVQTLARAYSLLRDGNPDWVLLKAGDVWNESFPSINKSANSSTQYMVITSYGTGPRPQLRTTSPAFYGGGGTIRRGLAIVDLDLAPSTPGSGYGGITFLESWGHVLIEGCSIIGYPDNIIIQETGSGRLPDMQIRRCVLADSEDVGPPHSQGLFMGSCDDWLVEGCIIDNNARDKADMFCHNVYIHQTSGPGIFRENISARACSHGVQQRPGGTMENNLFLQNPINAYQGKSASDHPAATNYVFNNVVLDSRDINIILPRGFGYVLGGADNTVIEYNVAAHQQTGSSNVTAFSFDGINAATVHGNFVYDWTYQYAGWGTAYQWDTIGYGPVLFTGNFAYQPNDGMCVRHEGRALDASFTYTGNSYFSTNPATGYQQFSSANGIEGSWSWWRGLAGEQGSTFGNPGSYDVTIGAYMQSIGLTGSVDEFMAQARLQSKQYWRPQLMSATINNWVRARLGMGSASGSCYANCDNSTAPPILNVLDLQCFMSEFAAQNPAANCDGSTAAPVLNVNDFACFMNKFAAGCP